MGIGQANDGDVRGENPFPSSLTTILSQHTHTYAHAYTTHILFLSPCSSTLHAISPIRAHAADVTDVSRESAKAEDFGMHASLFRMFLNAYVLRVRSIGANDRAERF